MKIKDEHLPEYINLKNLDYEMNYELRLKCSNCTDYLTIEDEGGLDYIAPPTDDASAAECFAEADCIDGWAVVEQEPYCNDCYKTMFAVKRTLLPQGWTAGRYELHYCSEPTVVQWIRIPETESIYCHAEHKSLRIYVNGFYNSQDEDEVRKAVREIINDL